MYETGKHEKMKEKRLTFQRVGEHQYKITNKKDELLGLISYMRVGRFMHWCFEPHINTFFTNGCLREVSHFITTCYGQSKKIHNCTINRKED